MLFHTWDFALFFAIFYPVFLMVRRTRLRTPWLLAASYLFYSWWNPVYLILIAATTAVDFKVAHRIETSPRPGRWLVLSLASNLIALLFFKYAGFLARNLNALLGTAGLGLRLPVADFELPLGLSFFTFQSMSYTIDVYRRTFPAERNLLRFAVYVSFFPQMISGPICRAATLLPQLREAPVVTFRHLTHGASLFLVGLFKKVALADYLAMYVNRVYASPADFQGPALFLASAAFAWQIYFDFSGYIDMARGIAHAMGYELTVNFRSPYTATGLGDFWSRWNITVSTWFRDYVYIPLGGNRRGRGRTCRNILITMLVSGFWHGASWTYVLWGALHGLGMVAGREIRPAVALKKRLPRFVLRIGVFVFVTLAWVFFRSPTLESAALIVSRIFTSGWADPRFPLLMALPVLVVWAYQILTGRESRSGRLFSHPAFRVALAVLMIGYLSLVSQPSTQTFIYFQF